MVKRKERIIRELYDGTVKIHELEVPSEADKGVSRPTKSENLVKVDPGTCNVCSAPCSSCLHIRQTQMESKITTSLDETLRESTFSYSVNDSISTKKSRACEILQHTASETSNVIDAEVPHKLLSGGSFGEKSYTSKQRERDADKINAINKFEDIRGLEGHDDNISCINEANEALKSSSSKEVQTQNASCPAKNELDGRRNKSSGEVVSGQRYASNTSGDIQDQKHGLVGGNSEPSAVACPKVEAESDSTDYLPTENLNSKEQRIEAEKAGELLALPDAKETSMQSEPVNESDESEDVVEDVKVCDICGDAGREELLAVCSRCSEGAEHTYCMQDMLAKIPEGIWLCQDCKSEEKCKQNLVDGDGTDGHHKNSGKVDSRNGDLCGKLDGIDAPVDVVKDQKHSSHVKLSRKRNADDEEVSSLSKRQALEPTTWSPKISSPKRVGMLSGGSSSKSLDRGRVKPANISSGNNAPEVPAPSLDARLTSRGTFLKSKSFSAASAKPKDKLVDEVVPQKQISKRDAASDDTKGGLSRMMGKSMSFRSVNSGRVSSTDSKAKMLSPKFSHAQDIKGQKHTKDRSLGDRRNSFRSERPLVNSTVTSSTTSSTTSSPRVDRNLAVPPVRGETVPFSTASNNRELKAVQSDSKLTQLSRPVNRVVCKDSEASVPLGDSKRQLSLSASGITNLGEKSTQARTTPCQKCNNIGHSAEFCTIDSTEQSLAGDVPTSRSSKEVMSKGNRLKAAIEAAMLKKPGIYRKNRDLDQADASTVSGINTEVSSQDQLSNTINQRKLVPGEEVNEQLASAWNYNAESAKLIPGTSPRQFTKSAEVVNRWSEKPIPHADGKYATVDLPGDAPVATSGLSVLSAVPEQNYVWQGCFEVRRGGKLADCYDGFQAHLSACASARVLETTSKFRSTILLDEVPRASTWPMQFEQNRVNEDHIALYFFARDYASYEKSYKILLESMMRNDLALKGNIDDLEILIFPSNHLPVKYQRWNLMFFFWGLFRGKRVSCLPQGPVSPKKIYSSRDMPTANISLPENICSPVPVDKDVPPWNKSCKVVSDVHSLIDLQCLPSTKTMSGDTKAVYLSQQQGNCVISTEEQPEYKLDCNSVPSNHMKPPQSWQDIRSGSTSLEGQVDSECKVIKEPLTSIDVTNSASNVSGEKKPGHSIIPADRHASSLKYSEVSAGVQALTSISSFAEVSKEDKTKPWNVKIGQAETVQEIGTMRFSGPMELNSWPLTDKKRAIFEPTLPKSEATSTGSIQDVLWNDTNSITANVESASKKQKLDYSDLYVSTDHTSSPRNGSLVQDSVPNFLVKNRYGEGSDEALISRTSRGSERYFFPVDPYHVKHVDLGDSSILHKRVLSDNGEALQGRVPNLELALGAEIKPPLKQSIPHFLAAEVGKNNRDQPPGRTITMAEEDVSAALSLSLSFPSSNKEQVGQPKEHLPGRRPEEVNFTSLFRGLSDK